MLPGIHYRIRQFGGQYRMALTLYDDLNQSFSANAWHHGKPVESQRGLIGQDVGWVPSLTLPVKSSIHFGL